MLWAVGDIVENCAALSRWHPDYVESDLAATADLELMRSSTMSQSNRAITDDPTDRSFLKRDQNDQRNDPDWGDHFP